MAAVALVFAAGCGGAAEQTLPTQLGELRSEILRLRADHAALSDRLDAMERGPAGPSGTSARPSDRPELETVRLAPETAEESASVDEPQEEEDSARVVLRSTPGGGVVEDSQRAGADPVKSPAAKKPKR